MENIWQVIKTGKTFAVTCNGFPVQMGIETRVAAKKILDRLQRAG